MDKMNILKVGDSSYQIEDPNCFFYVKKGMSTISLTAGTVNTVDVSIDVPDGYKMVAVNSIYPVATGDLSLQAFAIDNANKKVTVGIYSTATVGDTEIYVWVLCANTNVVTIDSKE